MAKDKVLSKEQQKGKERLLKERVGWAIRQHVENGATQKDVADALGTGQSEVTHWKKERRIPREKFLYRLPTILDVDGHWLMTGEGDPYQHKRMEVLRRATEAELDDLRAMLDATEGLAAEVDRRAQVRRILEDAEALAREGETEEALKLLQELRHA